MTSEELALILEESLPTQKVKDTWEVHASSEEIVKVLIDNKDIVTQLLKSMPSFESNTYWIDENGFKHEGVTVMISGDASNISGDVSRITGNVTDLKGSVTGIRGWVSFLKGDISKITDDISGIIGNVTQIIGDVTGVKGSATGISVNIDKCNLTLADRRRGVNINDLIRRLPCKSY